MPPLTMSPSSHSPGTSSRAFFQVLKLHQRVYATLEAALADQALTPPQYTALSLVRHHEPVSPADLSRMLGITAQSTGETVKALASRGLIIRAPIPNNKRSISLRLTDAGQLALSVADLIVAESERKFFSRLSPRAFQQLLEGIRVLRDDARPLSPPADKSLD
jgi:DNA-binding MarR family transcriptional regulator